MDKKELIKKMLDYKDEELNIVIVGPDCSNSKNKLRIYALGGRIGKIAIDINKKKYRGKSELMDVRYCNYCPSLKPILDVEKKIKMNRTSEEIEEILISEKYLKLAKEALMEKWRKKKTRKEKERDIENKIVKKFMNTNNDWAIIDMEMQCPNEWLKTLVINDGETKQPRFDLIVLNNEGIGIIELKVDEDNCNNLKSHYKHMSYIQENSDQFIEQICKRIDILDDYELISKKTKSIYEKQKNNLKVWCGFLFVGQNIEKAKKIVKNNLEKIDSNNEKYKNFKYLYCDKKDINNLDLNHMLSYQEFMNI